LISETNKKCALICIAALTSGGAAYAAPEVQIARDNLDKALSGPDLLGGITDDQLIAYVGDTETYDDNIFRLPPNVDVATLVGPDASKGDRINSPSAGLDGQWSKGRQIVEVSLRLQDNLFSKNTDLNNVSTSDRVAWNWAVSDLFSGQLGADYQRNLASFVNSTVFGHNIYQRSEYFATGRYQIGPRWDVYGGVMNAQSSLDQQALKVNDTRQKYVDAGVELVTNADDSVALDYRYNDSRYPNGVVLNGSSFDPDFREDRAQIMVKRVLSDKTTLNANFGYQKRDYANTAIGSFKGPIWRGAVGWDPTEKTLLIFTVWRELQAYLTDETNYYRGTGVSIAPTWNVSEKISVTGIASRESQVYIGSGVVDTVINPESSLGRKDNVTALEAGVHYLPIKALSFDLTYRHEQRTSNQELRLYTDQLATLQARFLF
jgi:exopolysaccharide biosynthesis operon protein EpsL